MTSPFGPSCPAAAVPIAPKMPAPITAPIASMIRSPAPSVRFRPCSPSVSCDQGRDRLALEELRHGLGLYVTDGGIAKAVAAGPSADARQRYAVSFDDTTRPPRGVERDADQARARRAPARASPSARHAIQAARRRPALRRRTACRCASNARPCGRPKPSYARRDACRRRRCGTARRTTTASGPST